MARLVNRRFEMTETIRGALAMGCTNGLCERYQDCLPGDQDEEVCRVRCDDRSPEEVDACDACLDRSGCDGCGVECAGPLAGA